MVSDPQDCPASTPTSNHVKGMGRHFIFVHGYDVNVQSARGWAAEMFKRLRQSGSCSKFTAVDWYGNDSEIPGWVPKYGGEAPNYYANVEHAFATASRFVVDCASLTGDSPGRRQTIPRTAIIACTWTASRLPPLWRRRFA